MCKLNAVFKWVQSPSQNVKSHVEKKSINEQGNAHYGPRPAKVAGKDVDSFVDFPLYLPVKLRSESIITSGSFYSASIELLIL